MARTRTLLLGLLLSGVLATVLASCGGDTSFPVYNPDAGTVPGTDVQRPDRGSDPGEDVPAGTDTQTGDPDTAVPLDTDEDAGSVTPPDTVVGPDQQSVDDVGEEPKEAFGVVSAFSADGEAITVRFTRDVDLSSVSADHFELIEQSTPIDVLTSASVDGPFVSLTIAAGTVIDADLQYKIRVSGPVVAADDGESVDAAANQATIKRSVYLNIVWHQHQPLYLDPLQDELLGPWVRKHATKDYYDMAAILAGYPEVHVTINLTIVMLDQLQIYLDRLGPYVDVENNTVDEEGFLAAWRGKTDPWVDLLLEDTPSLQTATEEQLDLLYAGAWACVSTHPSVIARFPEYERVRYMNPMERTVEDLLILKLMFEFAWFDPDFLDGPVEMPDGTVVDLTDLIQKGADGKYRLIQEPSEEMANRLLAEEYKIMANVVAIHRELRYAPDDYTGQIEISTTPFYHPILPLIYDTNLASIAADCIDLPQPSYSQPQDARAHVLRAIGYYERLFGEPPRGMWPGEGSVAEAIVPILVSEGVNLTWVATGQETLACSDTSKPSYYPYRIDADTASGDGGDTDDEMLIVFRHAEMSDKMGFKFQTYQPEDAANEFISDVLSQAPRFGAPDRLVTIILDGENAWENYTQDHDAKQFFHHLYSKLNTSSQLGEIVPLTPTEYVTGNPTRGIPAHPIHGEREIEPLWAGSWIAGYGTCGGGCGDLNKSDFVVWIGEGEENTAWQYLAQARADLSLSGLAMPNFRHPAPEPEDDPELYATWMAFDSIMAAEGSDWFWWYGDDMTTPANDDSPFDQGFRLLLESMYSYMNDALVLRGEEPITVPDFAPIIQEKPIFPDGPFTDPPTIDGELVPSKTEWLDEGGQFADRDSGAMASPNDDIKELYYGWTEDAEPSFYVALVATDDLSTKLGSSYDMTFYLTQKHVIDAETGEVQQDPGNPETVGGYEFDFADAAEGVGGATWRLQLDFSGASAVANLFAANGSGGWTSASHNIEMGFDGGTGSYVIELRIPMDDLNLAPGDPLEFMVACTDEGSEIDYAPNFGAYEVFQDETALVYVTWEVDVSGELHPLNIYTELCTQPPPSGNGIVYIVGNQKDLGLEGEEWVPNKVALVDNGVDPDETANDRKWSFRSRFTRGEQLQWKYTIGLPNNEGSWNCTEEYPISFRGYLVSTNPDVSRIVIREFWADKPPGGLDGVVAEHTSIECYDAGGTLIPDCQ